MTKQMNLQTRLMMDLESELQLKLKAEAWKFFAEKAGEGHRSALDMVEVLLKQRDELGNFLVAFSKLKTNDVTSALADEIKAIVQAEIKGAFSGLMSMFKAEVKKT